MKNKVIIIGAGISSFGGKPSALIEIDHKKNILDLLLESISIIPDPDIHFVGGYRGDDIIGQYPDLKYHLNEDWDKTGSLSSLLKVPFRRDENIYIFYADILIEKKHVKKILDTPSNIAILGIKDEFINNHHSNRNHEYILPKKQKNFYSIGFSQKPKKNSLRFGGVLKLSKFSTREIIKIKKKALKDKDSIIDLLSFFSKKNSLELVSIPSQGWREYYGPDGLAKFLLGTKAETLLKLKPILKKSKIKNVFFFTVEDWDRSSQNLLKEIKQKTKGKEIIIRSSSLNEDGWKKSNAGRFESILNVNSQDPEEVKSSVESVIKSYGIDKNKNDQILIQEMISDVKCSGVAFTRTADKGSPFYLINYDLSNVTDSVTSGTGKDLNTLYIRRGIKNDLKVPKPLKNLLPAIQEIESKINYSSLDIEFAIDEKNNIFVLQVRPLVSNLSNNWIDDETASKIYSHEIQKYKKYKKENKDYKTPLFSNMTDWNPAEIIGTTPRPLAYSLYEFLVTDNVWSQQRYEYGYSDYRNKPLMIEFCGKPYINVTNSLGSLIPRELDEDLKEKILNKYLSNLRRKPYLHDKVEFEISINSWSFDLNEKINKLLPELNKEERKKLIESIKKITDRSFESLQKELAKIEFCSTEYDLIEAESISSLSKALKLLKSCKEHGTLPFAHIARSAFLATNILNSMVNKNFISKNEKKNFINSLNTITSEIQQDGIKVYMKDLKFKDFIKKYGHLRPGTYEITSPRYSSNPSFYLKPLVKKPKIKIKNNNFNFSNETLKTLDSELNREGIKINARNLINFIKKSIYLREFSKFVFTKNISQALLHIEDFGKSYDLSIQDLSFVSINYLIDIEEKLMDENLVKLFKKISSHNKMCYQVNDYCELPDLIKSEQDFTFFKIQKNKPNFITNSKVSSKIVCLDEKHDLKDLEDSIVFISSADPGFDWIFGHKIKALVTKFGGINSHMAIRCAELNIPAAIGIGEDLFKSLLQKERIALDCDGKIIK
tara:strand:+ start:2442 stop:5450 length:3009 start_codon:yes stop_codon:yes gene_type:complete